MPSVEEKLKWNERFSTRTRICLAVVGFLTLFTGVCCQWYSANHINDASLEDFCEAYSGHRQLNGLDEWATAKNDYYARYGDSRGPMSLKFIASQFLGFRPDRDYPLNEFLETSPSFWCKYLPKCPPGVQCADNEVQASANWTRGAWVGRPISTNAHWEIRDGMPFTNDRIRCVDRRDVYFDMMRMVLTDRDNKWVRDEDTGTYWTEEMVAAASRELLRDCIGRKAANAFFLGLGPFMCTVSVLTCLFTMFKYCTSPFMLSSGKSVMLIAIAITLIDFWLIVYSTNGEFIQGYMPCSNLPAPIVQENSGGYFRYFDGTICADRNSLGEVIVNPFLSWSATVSGSYTAGGVLNLLAIGLTLIAISKAEEGNTVMRFQNLGPSDEM